MSTTSTALVQRAPTALWGWGANKRVDCFVDQPQTPAQVGRQLAQPPGSAGSVARGLGRSYGDAATNERGQVLDLSTMDRYLGFDPATGTLECEAGTSLAQIIADFGPRGFFPAITPGTKYVTVGGCIANDIHGKAHHTQGSFCECVESMTVLLASGEVVRASRDEHADLFWANFGGMGLLGVILTARLRLRPITTTYFRQRAIKVDDLDAMLAALEEYDHEPYSVAWIDPFATGARLGRGVLTVGDHAEPGDLPPALAREPLKLSGGPKLTVPFEAPELVLNKLSIRMLNVVLETVLGRGKPIAHYEKFFYPLDAIGEWWRGYGRRGFTQWQFVIPLEDGPARMREILEAIAVGGQLPFLNVLKKMGPASEGILSFPFEGYTFAIDFPVRDGLAKLLAKLDAMVLDAGGRIYLGKDSYLAPDTFRAMYPQVERWLEIKAKYDPQGVFRSDLGRRLGLS